MRMDGRTDMTKLIVPFRNYVNTSKNIGYNSQSSQQSNRGSISIPVTYVVSPKRNRTFEIARQ